MAKNSWRDTLFVWDGILSWIDKEETKDDGDGCDGEDSKACKTKNDVQWNGTLVRSIAADAKEVPAPRRGAFDEYVSSEHSFNVEGVVIMGKSTEEKKDGKVVPGPQIIGGDSSSLHRVVMNGGTGYELGEGSEKTKHKDDRHDMYFFSPLRWTGKLRDQVDNIVFALGENEFGRFISVGWLRVGNRVTLARRYVDETDERADWDLDDLRSAVFDQIATTSDDGHIQLVIPPWQCCAMNADPGQLSKRQKHE